jgi:hypothetical protein
VAAHRDESMTKICRDEKQDGHPTQKSPAGAASPSRFRHRNDPHGADHGTVLNRTAHKSPVRPVFCGPHPIAVVTTAAPASRLAKINQLAALR